MFDRSFLFFCCSFSRLPGNGDNIHLTVQIRIVVEAWVILDFSFSSCFTSNSSATPARSALKYIWNLLLSNFSYYHPFQDLRAEQSPSIGLPCSICQNQAQDTARGLALWSLKLNFIKKITYTSDL